MKLARPLHPSMFLTCQQQYVESDVVYDGKTLTANVSYWTLRGNVLELTRKYEVEDATPF